MDHFSYRDGRLHCEEAPVDLIAARVGTPTYVYSAATIVEHYRRIENAFAPLNPLICFAVKACSNLSVLRLLGDLGAGMDVVSGGELYRAAAAGVRGAKVVYAGVGKTQAEIREALEYRAAENDEAGIRQFNVESEGEFEAIARVAAAMGRTADCALRVNPDVDPQTHAHTATGRAATKFGIDHDRVPAFFQRYGRMTGARLRGLHIHIGSPVYSIDPYVEAVRKSLDLIDRLRNEGYEIDTLDLGGGFGADYVSEQSPPAAAYAERIVPLLEDRVKAGLRIVLEPGRQIVANAGILLVRVLYRKESGTKRFVITDGGMSALMRPALYEAFHFVWPADVAPEHAPQRRSLEMDMVGLETVDVVGPVCEVSDHFARDRKLPPVAPGDLLAVFAAGAYGATMASRYNSFPLPAEVLVDGDRIMLARRRETYHDLVSHELTPTLVETRDSGE